MGIAPEMGRAYLCSIKKKGFRETTTRDIAREAGVNPSNLYHYFASKDELFRKLLKPATDTLETLLNEHHGIKGHDVLSMQEEGYVEATLGRSPRRRPFFVLEQNETLFTIATDIWIRRNRFCNLSSHTRGRERC